MNTPTHLILAAAVFAKPNQPKLTWAALIGGFLPDLSLYFMVIWHKFVLNTSEPVIFDEVYFSKYWQFVFSVDNSFFVWGAILGLALVARSGWLIALAGAGFLHLMFDFPLHNDDARVHFWPVTDWKFESPVSYWDPAHYGNIMAPMEYIFALILLAILWRRFSGRFTRIFLLFLGLAPGLVMAGVYLAFGWHH